jgi:tetratricopeptide (TPR) repeat protein
LERALAIDEKALGPHHPSVAIDLNNLGQLLQDLGDFDAARPLLERALQIKEKSLGPDHPSTILGRDNLALLLAEMEDNS